ncbi:MAG: prephenate dehydrogenase/arogenate dehydrogenase family protein [Zetaproteobacteria bacterium]|nr:MAG: prephenate dehydrogenase/arogenate dehydrogenase family protein [Zetaproteobacteria bacterium]
MKIDRLVVIGVGLIGGSVARALRRARWVEHITGVGRGRENLDRARELGIIDDWTHDVGEAVRTADMVLIAVPMGAYASVFAAMADNISSHVPVTDAGSTKQHALREARRWLPYPERFVPAHPIAGTERSGAEASFAELFEDRWCILTPEADTDPHARNVVEAMWRATGSRVIHMDAAEHDDCLAAVSHLPHVAAYALVNAVCKSGGADPFRFAAGGFRDFTRIASSSPEMWRDIVLANRDAVLRKLDAFRDELASIAHAIETGDAEGLAQMFAQAKHARDAWLETHGGRL